MKWGYDIKVFVFVSFLGVGKCVVFGMICVIMFIGVFEIKEFGFEVNCNVKVVDEVSYFDFEGKG